MSATGTDYYVVTSSSDFTRVSRSGKNKEIIIQGIMGYYEIDRSTCLWGQHNSDDWYFVEITWNVGSNTFTWQNKAGVSWTLTPIGGSGGWDITKLALGNDNPYFNDGYTTAVLEWGTLEGRQVVTTIKGPWGTTFLRNLEGESFVSKVSTSTNARKPEPSCDDKLRKVREERDQELEKASFEGEEHLVKIRMERDQRVERIQIQMKEEVETIQTRRRQQIIKLDADRKKCEMKNDEETCRSGWDLKIEEQRIHFEEQYEILREERDTETVIRRLAGDEKLKQVRIERKQQIDAHQEASTKELMSLTQEREACKGDIESCQDKFDTEINQVRVKMEEETKKIRLELDTVLESIEIERKKQVDIIELERKTELDQLRTEWKMTCTDKCNVCRETQDQLLEKVHAEQEEKLVQVLARWDETVRKERLATKGRIEIVQQKSRTQIEKIYAKRSGCPEVAEKEKETCKAKLEIKLIEVRDKRDVELQLIHEVQEEELEYVRLEMEEQLEVIRVQKTEQMNKLAGERNIALEALRTSRLKCAQEGQQKVESCTENIDGELERVRSERDEQLLVVRTQHEQQIKTLMAVGQQQLVRVQAQLTEQLKNIREQHYELIEKVMRKCEGGKAAGKCPELDCSTCPLICRWGEWTAWESCTVTCGGGTQTSTRAVDRQPRNGGSPCEGESTRDQDCNTNSCAAYKLLNGEILQEGQELKNAKDGFHLIMQHDGNLVLYKGSGHNNPIWSSKTYHQGQGPYRLVMQTDNNLVLYDANSRPTWSSHTHNKGTMGSAMAILQDDGNFVVYKGKDQKPGEALWHSNTWRHGK